MNFFSNGKVSTTDSTQSVDDKQSEDSGTDETALPPGWQKCEGWQLGIYIDLAHTRIMYLARSLCTIA